VCVASATDGGHAREDHLQKWGDASARRTHNFPSTLVGTSGAHAERRLSRWPHAQLHCVEHLNHRMGGEFCVASVSDSGQGREDGGGGIDEDQDQQPTHLHYYRNHPTLHDQNYRKRAGNIHIHDLTGPLRFTESHCVPRCHLHNWLRRFTTGVSRHRCYGIALHPSRASRRR
jgi:hypothetical protein